MNKQEFLGKLRKGLSGLPKNDIEDRLTFYREMIEDRMEEGLSEEDAVSEIGNADELISQIVADVSRTEPVKEKMTPKKRMRAWEIVLLILGSPIWLSLLIAVFAIIFSLYVVLWSVVVSLWALFGSLIGCAFGGIVAGVGFAFGSNTLSGIAMIGAGIVCAGLSIFMFLGCKASTKGIVILTKKLARWTKNCFVKKEEA